jgi:hypothetical protein
LKKIYRIEVIYVSTEKALPDKVDCLNQSPPADDLFFIQQASGRQYYIAGYMAPIGLCGHFAIFSMFGVSC